MTVTTTSVLFLVTLGIACTSDPGSAPATRQQCRQVSEKSAALRIEQVRATSRISEADLRKHQSILAKQSEASIDACTATKTQAWAQHMLERRSL